MAAAEQSAGLQPLSHGGLDGSGGTVNGLAAIVTGGLDGSGGTVNGLAAIVTGGLDGSGGTVNGLAAIVTGGLDGSGGTVNGLAAIVTGGLDGSGGTVSGLATAIPATATMAATKIKLRTFNELAVMNVHSLTAKGLCKERVTQKCYAIYNKSNIARIFFAERPFFPIWHQSRT